MLYGAIPPSVEFENEIELPSIMLPPSGLIVILAGPPLSTITFAGVPYTVLEELSDALSSKLYVPVAVEEFLQTLLYSKEDLQG